MTYIIPDFFVIQYSVCLFNSYYADIELLPNEIITRSRRLIEKLTRSAGKEKIRLLWKWKVQAENSLRVGRGAKCCAIYFIPITVIIRANA